MLLPEQVKTLIEIGNLAAASIDFGIGRIRTAFLTDSLQTLRLNGQNYTFYFLAPPNPAAIKSHRPDPLFLPDK